MLRQAAGQIAKVEQTFYIYVKIYLQHNYENIGVSTAAVPWSRDQLSQQSLAQSVNPQNCKQINNGCFKLLNFGMVCYAAKAD